MTKFALKIFLKIERTINDAEVAADLVKNKA